MPTTGRSYFPNVPGPLEQALATQLGTNPWAPAFYTNAQNERRSAVDAVNETQAQQYVLGLQSALQQERVKAGAGIIGAQVRGGHGLGAAMGAANAAGYTRYDPTDIARENALGSAGEIAGVAKSTGEASAAATKAGTPYDLSSLNGILPGLLRLNQGTPEDITKEGMGNRTAIEVARINAAAKDRATAAKGKSGSKGGPKATATYATIDGPTVAITDTPDAILARLSPEQRSKIGTQSEAAGNAIEHNGMGATHDTSGDATAQDPELAAQQAFLVQQGYRLYNGHGDARTTTQNGKIGKIFNVTGPDGKPTHVFVPNARQ